MIHGAWGNVLTNSSFSNNPGEANEEHDTPDIQHASYLWVEGAWKGVWEVTVAQSPAISGTLASRLCSHIVCQDTEETDFIWKHRSFLTSTPFTHPNFTTPASSSSSFFSASSSPGIPSPLATLSAEPGATATFCIYTGSKNTILGQQKALENFQRQIENSWRKILDTPKEGHIF